MRFNLKMRNFSLIALARVIVIACQFINIKLFTSYLTVSQIGLYFFFLTVSYFCNALIFVPVDYYQQACVRKCIEETGGVKSLLLFNIKLILIYLSSFSFLVFLCSLAFPKYTYHIILTAALSVALYSVQALRGVLNNLSYSSDVSFNLVQEAVIKIIIFIFLIQFIQASELLLMAAWVITLIVSLVTLYLRAKNYGLFFCNKDKIINLRDVFHFAYPISFGAVANWVQTQGYRLILVPLGYAEVLGFFATVTSIGSAGMAAVSTIFAQAFTPKIYNSDGRYTSTYLKNALIVIAAVILGSLLFGAFIVKIVTNPKYEQYWSILIIGVIIEATNLLIGAIGIHITLFGTTKRMMMSSVIGLLILILSFIIFYITKTIDVYSIGLPLVLAQLAVLGFIYRSYLKCPQL